jgi:hypothetical protein
METIKHAIKSECLSVIISMDAEQMLFRTDKEGFYALAQGKFIQDGVIQGLDELLEIDVEPESADDFEVQLRVFAVEYTVKDKNDSNQEV